MTTRRGFWVSAVVMPPQATAAIVAPISKAQSAEIMGDELECWGTATFSDGSERLSIPGIN